MADKTVSTKHVEGIPMTEEELKEYEKVWTDMEEAIEYCEKHPCKLE